MITLEDVEKSWNEIGQHGDVDSRLERANRWLPYYQILAKNETGIYKVPESKMELVDKLKYFTGINKDSVVLDIGAGTGNNALPLAEAVKRVDALEVSADSINIIQKRMTDTGIENIRTINEVWERYSCDERYDLVFASMCPAICNSNELIRMEEMSKGYCALIAHCNGSYDKHRKEMMRRLGIIHPSGMATEAFYYYNTLYLTGRAPSVYSFHTESISKVSVNVLMERYPVYFKIFGIDESTSIEFLKHYLDENAADGYLEEESRTNYSLITWKVN